LNVFNFLYLEMENTIKSRKEIPHLEKENSSEFSDSDVSVRAIFIILSQIFIIFIS